MTITTKFEIGDTVWTIWDDKAQQVTIVGFTIYLGKNATRIDVVFNVRHAASDYSKGEDKLFKTKEELISNF